MQRGRIPLIGHGIVPVRQTLQRLTLGRLGSSLSLDHAQSAKTSDSSQPAGESGRIVEVRQGLIGDQQGVLRHLFGGCPAQAGLLCRQCDRTTVASYQLIERAAVSNQRCQHQHLIGGQTKRAGPAFEFG